MLETDTMRDLHQRVSSALNLDAAKIGLALKNELIVPPLEYASLGWDSTLNEVGIVDESEVFFVLKRPDGGFEEPNYIRPKHPPDVPPPI